MARDNALLARPIQPDRSDQAFTAARSSTARPLVAATRHVISSPRPPSRGAAMQLAAMVSPRARSQGDVVEDQTDAGGLEAVHVIDDDPSIRSALMNLLSAAGLNARSYDSVDAFLEDHGQAQAGCFLLDVRLPGLNGLDFLPRMAAMGFQLPVILISGHGDIPMTVRGMKAGAVDFLEKPFNANEVLEAVQGALRKDRARRQVQASHMDVVERFESLSPRQRQVMELVTAGQMNKQAANALGLSEVTVKVYRAEVMRKMGVRTLADLVKLSSQITAIQSASLVAEDL